MGEYSGNSRIRIMCATTFAIRSTENWTIRLVYRKRLRRPLDEYERNVPPHVRAARVADEFNRQQGRPLQYQNGGWISYVMTTAGPEPLETLRSLIDYEHYLTRQLQPVADAILPLLRDDFTTLISGQKQLF